MNPRIVFGFLSLLVALTACQSGNNTAAADPEASIRFDSLSFVGDKLISEKDTIYAATSFRYPVVTLSETAVAQKINDYIQRKSQGGLPELYSQNPDSVQIKPLEEASADFFAEAEKSTNDENPAMAAWTFNADTDTLMFNPAKKWLTLIHNYNAYTGGAHPNNWVEISNINLASGDLIDTADLFNTDEVKAAVKAAFVENETAAMKSYGEKFNMDNYFFDEGFALPKAMGLTRDGIKCVYSPYEAAAYARGAIAFTVPYRNVPQLAAKLKMQ